MFQTKVTEKIKPHTLHSVTFFENRAVYDIMRKNIVEPDRSQMTIWRMRITCWVTKATTNTPSEYVKYITSPQKQWVARTLLDVTL